jgi:hypothetical protein
MRHWTSLVISKEKLAKHLKDNWFDDAAGEADVAIGPPGLCTLIAYEG